MSTNYTVTAQQIINYTFRKLGIIEASQTPDDAEMEYALLALNLLVKQMVISGLKLWTINEYSLDLVSGQNNYELSEEMSAPYNVYKPIKLIQAWLRNTSVSPNIDTPIQKISRQEYNILGSKFSTGMPNSIYLDNTTATTASVYLYLTPDDFVASTYKLYFTAQRPISDLATVNDIPEFPIEWMQALVWGLADQLAIEYDVPANIRQEIAIKASAYMQALEAWDTEYTSVFFQPDMRMSPHYD